MILQAAGSRRVSCRARSPVTCSGAESSFPARRLSARGDPSSPSPLNTSPASAGPAPSLTSPLSSRPIPSPSARKRPFARRSRPRTALQLAQSLPRLQRLSLCHWSFARYLYLRPIIASSCPPIQQPLSPVTAPKATPPRKARPVPLAAERRHAHSPRSRLVGPARPRSPARPEDRSASTLPPLPRHHGVPGSTQPQSWSRSRALPPARPPPAGGRHPCSPPSTLTPPPLLPHAPTQ